MGLYNFKKRFVPHILDGSKQHTIRTVRANPDKAGNTLHLYTGLRQKGAKLLGRRACTKVETLLVQADGSFYIDGVRLSDDERNALAYRDGFRNRGPEHAFEEMWEFWKDNHTFPFVGHIIHWKWDE